MKIEAFFSNRGGGRVGGGGGGSNKVEETFTNLMTAFFGAFFYLTAHIILAQWPLLFSV